MTGQVIPRDRLGELSKIGQGGQGVVYAAPNVKTKFATSMVYKEYKPQTRTSIDFTALAAMPALVEDSLSYAQAERLVSMAAWPCALVEDNGTPTGFVMPAIPESFFIPLTTVKGVSTTTAEFQHLLNHPSVLAARGIDLDDAQRYALLRETASALGFLHQHGVCVGDISPKNLLFSLTPHPAVYFIDCDATRINGTSTLPQVETPGWEIPGGEELATIYSDTYKLGLLALRLLAGDHDTKNPDHLPTTTPNLLRQIITETLTNPRQQRPLPEAWTYVLGHAIEEAQHRQKAAAATAVRPGPETPPVPVVHSRPSTPLREAPTIPEATAVSALGAAAARPWTVTAAAVIAFADAVVFPVYGVISHLLFLFGLLAAVASVLLLIWGAIAALRGTTRAVLFVASPLAFAAASLLGLPPPGLALLAALAIPLLLVTRSSREFFRARAVGDRAFETGGPGASTPAHVDEPLPPAARRPHSRRKWPLIAAIVLVVAVAAGITGYVLWPNEPRHTVLPFTGLSEPQSVALDSAGNVYVVDGRPAGEGRVLKLAPGSSAPTVLPFTGLQFSEGMAVDSADAVYVTAADNQVLRLAPDARAPVSLACPGVGRKGIAVDSAGNVYVTRQNDVVKLAAGSGTQTVLPFAGLDTPWGVAVDAAGNLYVSDYSNNRVVELAAGSSAPTVLPFDGLSYPEGVAVNAAGDVYVADFGNNRVVKLAAGAATSTVVPYSRRVGFENSINEPTSVAVDAAGNLYVADWGNHRILKMPAG